jgi:hypothetical protein
MTNLKTPSMKQSSSVFLQIVIVLFGLGALALLLWEPHLEGRNKHATVFEVYFKDPFLAYVYVGSIPFFVALYQGFKVLGYAGKNQIFSQAAVNALRTIKRCAMAVIGFVVGAIIIILLQESDDHAGGVAMGVFIIFGSIVVATTAATFQRVLQNAVDLKSENDLTV